VLDGNRQREPDPIEYVNEDREITERTKLRFQQHIEVVVGVFGDVVH
jgi:hypothetical protein